MQFCPLRNVYIDIRKIICTSKTGNGKIRKHD